MRALTYNDDFQAFISARNEGRSVEIDEEMYMYWLEVLPPVDMMARNVPLADGKILKHADFLFAEGAEMCTAFWTERTPKGKKYFGQLTTVWNRRA